MIITCVFSSSLSLDTIMHLSLFIFIIAKLGFGIIKLPKIDEEIPRDLSKPSFEMS